jgi:hypothetical protein
MTIMYQSKLDEVDGFQNAILQMTTKHESETRMMKEAYEREIEDRINSRGSAVNQSQVEE